MADDIPLERGLDLHIDGLDADLRVAGRPVAGVRRVDDRLVPGLVFPTGRFQDVSLHPRALGRRLEVEAGRRRRDPQRWLTVTAGALVELAGHQSIDVRPADPTLDAVCAVLAFPLVRRTVEFGCAAPPTVPAWAAPMLKHADPDRALRALVDRPVTRATRRAFRDGLVAGGADRPIDLTPVGLAAALPDDWPVDHVATVLRGGGWLPPASWPSVEQIADLRRLWSVVPDDVGIRLLREALGSPTGPTELWAALRLVEDLLAQGVPTPMSIAGLHDLAEAEQRRARMPAAVGPQPARRAVAPIPAAPMYAPRLAPAEAARAVAGPAPFRWPPAVAVLDGLRDGDHQLVLPRDEGELGDWARILRNCLADYAPAVRAGRSFVAGMLYRGRLLAALELTPELTIRQFVGVRNARPSRAQSAALRRMLADVGITAAAG